MPSLSTVPTRAYSASIAHTPAQIEAAQRLRTSVFAGELGVAFEGELDTDEFDEVCDHLIVEHETTREVVGTYRLLPPGRSSRLYSAGEFDVSALEPYLPSLIEAGRSCVHPDHRGGAVINMMWSAMARYTLLSGHRYLAGCASVPLGDGGKSATSTWELAKTKHLSPPDLRVRPHHPWLPSQRDGQRPTYAQLPPLLRGYLRLGAWVCGPPAFDPDFDVADFFVLLPLDNIDERYLRYFLGEDR
ncbi:Putative hemolysin [Prauserella marina]|uniref:Putative hemolysin n=1 Tax=Prauserella marina TaxID=530584 RepID=A0A1G6NUQ2_9PSEU|nr:GNAT family N-acyltransferase [Prauserella marina]PWV82544.1 putative hemolysin [Prauserella marina]SDC71662.1 Putative hemolysin [Prauserella marina]